MSADNWTQCPYCGADATIAKDEQRQQVIEQYGKIPIPDWDQLRAAAEEPVTLDPSFSENWEIYLSEDCAVHIHYTGKCVTCGATTGDTHTVHPITRPT